MHTTIDNPYFPLSPRQKNTFKGSRTAGRWFIAERTVQSYGGAGTEIMGIPATIKLDLKYENDVLIESTSDYFAQDKEGNIWNLGEDVEECVYDALGPLTETYDASSWRAGVNGASPGLIMPAEIEPAFQYHQEYAPKEKALDAAQIFSADEALIVDSMTYNGVVKILKINWFDPDKSEFKYYATGITFIQVDQDLSPDLSNPKMVIRLVLGS